MWSWYCYSLFDWAPSWMHTYTHTMAAHQRNHFENDTAHARNRECRCNTDFHLLKFNNEQIGQSLGASSLQSFLIFFLSNRNQFEMIFILHNKYIQFVRTVPSSAHNTNNACILCLAWTQWEWKKNMADAQCSTTHTHTRMRETRSVRFSNRRHIE